MGIGRQYSPPPYRALAAKVWTIIGLIASIVLLLTGGIFFVFPSPWVFTFPTTLLAPPVVMIAEVGSLCVAFRKAVPRQIKRRTIIVLFLSLLAWGAFVGGVSFMAATCQQHPMWCT